MRFSKFPKSSPSFPNQKSPALPDLAAHSHCFSVGSETSIPAFSESHLQKSRASFHDTRTTLCSGR